MADKREIDPDLERLWDGVKREMGAEEDRRKEPRKDRTKDTKPPRDR